MALKQRSSSVDEGEVERFSRHGADWWDPRGPMAALHKFNPVRLGLYPRPGGGALWPRPEEARLPERPAHARYRLRRRHLVGAAGAAGRADGRRRSVPREHRGRERARAGERRYGRLPRHHGGGARRRRRKIRRGAGDGSGRARHRRQRLRRDLRRDGQAGRADDRRHAQPHAQELRAGDRRRRIRAALAAARHPSMGQVRHPGRARTRDSSTAACG